MPDVEAIAKPSRERFFRFQRAHHNSQNIGADAAALSCRILPHSAGFPRRATNQ